MFATFNLQLMPTATLDAAPETPVGMPVLSTETLDIEATGFAQLMRFQADTGTEAGLPHGDFVPEGGNILPVAEPIPTEAEALPPINVAAPIVADANADADAEVPVALTSWTPAPTLPEGPVDEIVSAIPQLRKPVVVTNTAEGRPEAKPQAPVASVSPEQAIPAEVLKPMAPPATETNQVGPATAVAAPVIRDLVQPDRRDIMMVRTEQPTITREVAAAPQTIVSPEAEVVPRVAAMAETTMVPDRSVPANNQTPALSGLANVANQLATATPRDPGLVSQVATDLVRTPVSDPSWGERIGQRVVMMAGNQVQQAEIRLTPAELGPVRVQIAVEDGAANVTFQAQHAVTREAIEAAMPRLREMLADSGLSLGQANVGGDGVAEGQRERRETANAAPKTETGTELADDSQPERQKTVTSDGLIDTFA